MVSALVGLILGAWSGAQAATPHCVARGAATAHVQAFVEIAPVRPTDTLVTATVCVVSTASRIGSYHGEVHYDTVAARLVRADAPEGEGLHAENTRESGRIRFAGAAPTGVSEPSLLTITLRVRKAGTRPVLRLDMRELNATDGGSLMEHLVAVPSQ